MKILIVKIGALGDVLRTTFIAQALKDKYRINPEIYWLTQKSAKPMFINNPYINKVITLENKNLLKNIFFGLVINLEEDLGITKFVSSLNYKKIMGFVYRDGKILPTPTAKEWFDMSALGEKPQNNILKKKNKKTHRQLMSEIIEIANYKKFEPFLRLTQKQRKFSKDFLRRHNFSRTDLIIGMNTGAAERWPKSLPIKKTAELIDLLYKKFKAKILLFGGPDEIERNNEILKLTKSPVIATGSGNNLTEFPALINVCNLFITSDSLGLHIALALKRKIICLVGPTSPNELEMYNLGEKIIANSKCVCCYKKNCKSMEQIELKQVFEAVKKILKQKITLVITAFKEPNISKTIESALNQETRYKYDIIVSAPDKETLEIARQYAKKNKNLKVLKDPGKGKSHALNLLFKKTNTNTLVLTDGDTAISNNAIEEISNLFLDPEIGCVSGRPVPIEDKKTKYGYWANFLFDAVHRIRKRAFESDSFLECSGYLFAFRKEHITRIPPDVAEDTVIPYFFWDKGYRIGYSENARVYVKNPNNFKDWIKQKIRTGKSHETLYKYVDIKTTPRVKRFKTEARGIFWALKYPNNLKEMFWTFQLIPARFYMWLKVFKDTKLLRKHYTDGWERVESTK